METKISKLKFSLISESEWNLKYWSSPYKKISLKNFILDQPNI